MSTTVESRLRDDRRHLHRIAETGWCEFETTAVIIERALELGIPYQTGTSVINPEFALGRNLQKVNQALVRARDNGVSESLLEKMQGFTGVVLTVDTKRPGPTVAMRFDIDGVDVNESDDPNHLPNREGFRARYNGIMHACAHDGHTAVGLSLAQYVHEHPQEFCGILKFVFQPAEEGVRGAKAMTEAGVYDDVDIFLASHLGVYLPSGVICPGVQGMFATKKFDVTFTGVAAHAAGCPEIGKNALVAACTAVNAIYGIPRHGKGITHLNVGTLHAGSGRNVIADKATMQIEVRGETAEICDWIEERLKAIVDGVAVMFGVTAEVKLMGEAVPLFSDLALIESVERAAEQVSTILRSDRNALGAGSDDCTVAAQRVHKNGGLATFIFCGSDLQGGHHQANFDFDEKMLLTSFELWVGILRDIEMNLSDFRATSHS